MSTATALPTYLETGDVARRLGVSHKTILVWERLGKLAPAAVTSHGTRLWDPDKVEAVRRERAANSEREVVTR